MYQPRWFDGEPTSSPDDFWSSQFQTPAEFWIEFGKGMIISTTLFCIFAAAWWSPKDPNEKQGGI